jgi:hypothetical protein
MLGKTVGELVEDTKQEMQQHKALLTKQYIKKGLAPHVVNAEVKTSTYFRSEMAGKLSEYQSIYRMMSAATLVRC